MILNERDSRHEQVLQVAQQMMTAARTAPKGKGVDIIEVAMVTESNIRILSDTMKRCMKTMGLNSSCGTPTISCRQSVLC